MHDETMFCIFKLPKTVDDGNNPQMRNNAHRYQNVGMFLFNKLGVVIFLIQEYIYKDNCLKDIFLHFDNH